jgi:hypothetical protein
MVGFEEGGGVPPSRQKQRVLASRMRRDKARKVVGLPMDVPIAGRREGRRGGGREGRRGGGWEGGQGKKVRRAVVRGM